MSSFVNIHIFAEVSSKEEASVVGSKLSYALKAFGESQVCNIKEYWKVPEYFEFSIELEDSSLSKVDCQKIAETLGTGWLEAGGSLIWNPTDNVMLLDPAVKWANLEFIEIA